jgi:acyl-CoA synthetase (AMP-forming)/AMP-acid ligase II
VKGLLNFGQVLARNAALHPNKIAARDLERAFSFRQLNERACRLGNALLGLGLKPGDRVAVLAYNCVEWAEIYGACAKAGLIGVPINFRLVGPEIAYIVENCEAAALIVQSELMNAVEEVRESLSVAAGNFIRFGGPEPSAAYRDYEALLASGRDTEPSIAVEPGDTWTLMYTSGTTGKPKGAIRSHAGSALMSFAAGLEFGLGADDDALLVMPMCHANSLYLLAAFAHCGATTTIFNRRAFDPEELVRQFADKRSTFTSLVPTHYAMMLDLPAVTRSKYDVDAMQKLLISSAPARRELKLAIMDYFRNSGLFEVYGSTEAGWVTSLPPNEQLTKLGSVGRECVGSALIKLLDENGREAPTGEPGELYSCNAWTFDGYWKLPEKTREAFKGSYCSVGDMARRDEDGYIYLVDRKSNMIISGGENVFPSEVEAVLCQHPAVQDVAVIGLPDEKWGERVHAVVVLKAGTASPDDLLGWCKDRIAGYKRPRSITYLQESEMPRTATGKILHRRLRDKILAR